MFRGTVPRHTLVSVKDRSVPHVIWDVATGLGGVVRKKSAGDGGVSVQKYIYLLTRAL